MEKCVFDDSVELCRKGINQDVKKMVKQVAENMNNYVKDQYKLKNIYEFACSKYIVLY